ncbi:VOC family protein [Arthrobacter sp. SD76]|uniref:VOC family protein n=1 Tax=Arthrobacter sp. SD76 TaxID=3415007 RepID=UPI003C750E29
MNAAGEFWRDVMMARESERVRLDDGRYGARWFRFHQKSYDVVYSDDWTRERGRFHHFAFAPDSREDILRAADICLENDVFIEYGPYKHAINQTFFLYVWEPGGTASSLPTHRRDLLSTRTGPSWSGHRPSGPRVRPGE